MRLRRSSLALLGALRVAAAASAVAASPAAAQRVRPWASASLGVADVRGGAESPCLPVLPLVGGLDAGLALHPVPGGRSGDPWLGVGVQGTRFVMLLSSNPWPTARLTTVRAGLGRRHGVSVEAGTGAFRYGDTRGRLRQVGVRLRRDYSFAYLSAGRVRATEAGNPGEGPRDFSPRVVAAGLGVGF